MTELTLSEVSAGMQDCESMTDVSWEDLSDIEATDDFLNVDSMRVAPGLTGLDYAEADEWYRLVMGAGVVTERRNAHPSGESRIVPFREL